MGLIIGFDLLGAPASFIIFDKNFFPADALNGIERRMETDKVR